MLEQALRTFLLTFNAITAEVVARIHVGAVKFGDSGDLPAITIEGHHHLNPLQTLDGGAVDLQFPLFDVVTHALLFETSIALGELVRRALLNLADGDDIVIDVNGVSQTVQIEQLTFACDPYCDNEEHIGHGQTDKPRVITIQVGWRQNVTAL